MKKFIQTTDFKLHIAIFVMMLFGLNAKGQISGLVYVDSNGNGQKDDMEYIVSGATILIFEISPKGDFSHIIHQAKTDSNGNYFIAPASFPVRIELTLEPKKLYLNSTNCYIELSEEDANGTSVLIMENGDMHHFGLSVPLICE